MKLIVRAKTEIKATEDINKLKRVLHNLFEINEDAIHKIQENKKEYLIAEANGESAITNLFNGFRDQAIVQAVRKYFLKIIKEDHISFMLNKQALYAKKYHICEDETESPMGPVWVTIESDKIEAVINYMVPETRKGKVLEVNYRLKDL